MALPWGDFVWTIKRWLSLYPTEAIADLPIAIQTADYSIADTDFYLVADSAAPITFTMLPAAAYINRRFLFKNKGAGTLTLDATGLGSIFTSATVATLAVTTGNWATLTSDGTTWLAQT